MFRADLRWILVSALSLALFAFASCQKKQPPSPQSERAAKEGPHYRVAATWGSAGSGPGEFDQPQGLAVDQAGEVYVADAGNCRVQVFSADGKFLRSWGSCGGEQGQFQKPLDVAIGPRGDVYVADFELDRVQVFSRDGAFKFSWGRPGKKQGEFSSPAGIGIGGSGTVYVVEFYGDRVQTFSGEGKPASILGREGHGEGQLFYPVKIGMRPNGNVFVADTHNQRIQEFDASGRALAQSYGFSGPGKLQFDDPTDVAIDGRDRIHVTDSGHNRVVMFDRDWKFVSEWQLPGIEGVHFKSPVAIAASGDGTLYVSDIAGDRIYKLEVIDQ